MKLLANSATVHAAGAATHRSARVAHGPRTFDLRGCQPEDDLVADLEIAGDDFGVVAVGDARADGDGFELLGRWIFDDPDGLGPALHVPALAPAAAERGGCAA